MIKQWDRTALEVAHYTLQYILNSAQNSSMVIDTITSMNRRMKWRRERSLTNNLIKQDYQRCRLKSFFYKFYCRSKDLVSKYNYLLLNHNWQSDCGRIIPFSRLKQIAHNGCDRSVQDAHSTWHLILRLLFNCYFSHNELKQTKMNNIQRNYESLIK